MQPFSYLLCRFNVHTLMMCFPGDVFQHIFFFTECKLQWPYSDLVASQQLPLMLQFSGNKDTEC